MSLNRVQGLLTAWAHAVGTALKRRTSTTKVNIPSANAPLPGEGVAGAAAAQAEPCGGALRRAGGACGGGAARQTPENRRGSQLLLLLLLEALLLLLLAAHAERSLPLAG